MRARQATTLATIADVADPVWRGSAIGVHRLWRDLGFVIGAIVALTAASGLVVLVRMRETLVRT